MTTNVGPTMPYGQFTGIAIHGVPFANFGAGWSVCPDTFSEPQAFVQFTGGSPAFTWTPARVGLYSIFTSADQGKIAIYDWYHEGTWYN